MRTKLRRVFSLALVAVMFAVTLPSFTLAEKIVLQDEVVQTDSLDTALNAEGGELHFDNSEDYPWTVDTRNGRTVGKSGNGGVDSSASTVSLTLDCEVGDVIGFDVCVSGQHNPINGLRDFGEFSVDGEREETYKYMSMSERPDTGWVEVWYTVQQAGTHTFGWSFVKDSSDEGAAVMDDAMFLDDVKYIPVNTPVTVTFVAEGEGTVNGQSEYSITVPVGTRLDEEHIPEVVANDEDHAFGQWFPYNPLMETRNHDHHIAYEDITFTANFIDTTGFATVTLTVPEYIFDGTGFQMLLDADADTFGRIFTPYDFWMYTEDEDTYNVDPEIYAEFEYKIPEDADGSTSTSNAVFRGEVTITIPAGVYDFAITNPTPDEGMYFINDRNLECLDRYDNFGFDSNTHYVFKITADNYIELALSIIPGEEPGVIGDVNQDGAVGTEDAILILRHALSVGLITDPEALENADVDGNGVIDAADALLTLRIALDV